MLADAAAAAAAEAEAATELPRDDMARRGLECGHTQHPMSQE
jgi:hypothetical protein